jgi:hypothetical protein
MISKVSNKEFKEIEDSIKECPTPGLWVSSKGTYFGFVYDNGVSYKADTLQEAKMIQEFHDTIWSKPNAYELLFDKIKQHNIICKLESL